ncbi:unnamed protein product, partial [Tetraodon nigroviridis]
MILQKIFAYMDFNSWVLLIFLLLLLIDVIRNWKPRNFPPGPWALPFVGNIFTGVDFKTVEKLSQKYGPVFSLRRGNERMVYITGHKMVKEALVNQLDSFVERPVVPLFHVVFKGIGKPFDPQHTITNAVGNIVCSIVFGHRFEYSDASFRRILELDNEAVVLAGSARTQLYDSFPSLMKHLPGPHQTVHANYSKITAFLKEEVDRHISDWNPEDPRDYIDTYLAEMEKMKQDPQAGFNVETLQICILDLIEAGTESAATTLRWGLVFILNHPSVQEKVQEEIDRVIGQFRQPALADRANMPYTEAVIHEIQRFANVVPAGFPKMASKDTTLGEYFIPKGSAITTLLSSVLFDKDEWETPDVFNPNHFLDSEGRFRKRDAFLPFSAGKRVCIGEQLAKFELFLFFTSILQRFKLSPVPGQMPSMEGVLGFTYSPQSFRLIAVPR